MHSYEHLRQISATLKLSRDVVAQMELICKEIENWDIFNSQLPRPRTIAAAVTYTYSKHDFLKVPKSLQDIKEAANISSDNTIKRYYDMLEKQWDTLITKATKRMENSKKANKTQLE